MEVKIYNNFLRYNIYNTYYLSITKKYIPKNLI